MNEWLALKDLGSGFRQNNSNFIPKMIETKCGHIYNHTQPYNKHIQLLTKIHPSEVI